MLDRAQIAGALCLAGLQGAAGAPRSPARTPGAGRRCLDLGRGVVLDGFAYFALRRRRAGRFGFPPPGWNASRARIWAKTSASSPGGARHPARAAGMGCGGSAGAGAAPPVTPAPHRPQSERGAARRVEGAWRGWPTDGALAGWLAAAAAGGLGAAGVALQRRLLRAGRTAGRAGGRSCGGAGFHPLAYALDLLLRASICMRRAAGCLRGNGALQVLERRRHAWSAGPIGCSARSRRAAAGFAGRLGRSRPAALKSPGIGDGPDRGAWALPQNRMTAAFASCAHSCHPHSVSPR